MDKATIMTIPTETTPDLAAIAKGLSEAQRPVATLSRLERQWLKRRYCGFCEASLLGETCFAYSGEHVLPIIEGVRDQEEIVDLGPPCDMDRRRARALEHYKPRAHLQQSEG